MIVPGALSLLLSLLQLSGMFKTVYQINIGFAEGHAGNGLGIYLLVASSLLYVIVTLKNLNPTVAKPEASTSNQAEEAINHERKAPTSTIGKILNKEINIQEAISKKPFKVNYKLIAIIVADAIIWGIYDQ